MAKPIQIVVTNVENNMSTQCNYVLFVLCDDGTIWEACDTRMIWEKLDGPWQKPLKDEPRGIGDLGLS